MAFATSTLSRTMRGWRCGSSGSASVPLSHAHSSMAHSSAYKAVSSVVVLVISWYEFCLVAIVVISSFYFRGAKVANNSQPHKPHQPHRNNTTTSCSAGETWRGRLFYIVYRSLATAWWTAVARKLPLFGYPVLLPTTCGV
ncbi:hypothetical protein O3689_03990 [Prevotella nigrescens]|uniref:hypothetical protein n=1 Tax=Prevotella nigrescens TaxID=28133 RepID=UPI00352CC95B